jgi:hypothetical protein
MYPVQKANGSEYSCFTDGASYRGLMLCDQHLGFSTNQYLLRILVLTLPFNWGRDSSVGIATGYGLGGPGIQSR